MTPAKRILVIDNDAPLRQSLAEQLRRVEKFITEEAETAAQALALVRHGGYDAVLLDDGLPDMDGRALCRAIRDEGVRGPVIMLTAPGGDAGLAAPGASDCVTKPFRLGTLMTLLRNQLRRFERGEGEDLALGPYRFRPAAKLLADETTGRKIRLTDKETAILRYLHRTQGKVVGRDELLGEVWGYNGGVTTHTLETHVYRLRQKIEPDPANARILITEPGGYRLGG